MQNVDGCWLIEHHSNHTMKEGGFCWKKSIAPKDQYTSGTNKLNQNSTITSGISKPRKGSNSHQFFKGKDIHGLWWWGRKKELSRGMLM